MILGSYIDDTSVKITHSSRVYILPSIILDCGRYNTMDILAFGNNSVPAYIQLGEGGYGLVGSSEVRPNLPTAADMQLEFPVTFNSVEITKVNDTILRCSSELATTESFFLSEMILLNQLKKPLAKAAFKQAIPIQANQIIAVEWLIGT